MDRIDTHHDAIEFPNGQVVMLTDLHPGQRATVLQLPVIAQLDHDRRQTKSRVTVIDAAPVRTYQMDHS